MKTQSRSAGLGGRLPRPAAVGRPVTPSRTACFQQLHNPVPSEGTCWRLSRCQRLGCRRLADGLRLQDGRAAGLQLVAQRLQVHNHVGGALVTPVGFLCQTAPHACLAAETLCFAWYGTGPIIAAGQTEGHWRPQAAKPKERNALQSSAQMGRAAAWVNTRRQERIWSRRSGGFRR